MKRGIQLITLLGLILAFVFVQHRLYLKDESMQIAEEQVEVIIEEEPNSELIDYSDFYMKVDTVYLPNPSGYTFRVNQEEINHLIDSFPELFQEQMLAPKEAAEKAWKRKLIQCFADEDHFHIQYYYLMRKRNGEGFWTEPREKLQTMFMLLNDLSLCEGIGGNYHGHEIAHILADTEFDIYLLKNSQGLLHDSYDMSKQIHLYIECLRQWVRDENGLQLEYKGAEKVNREKEFQIIVDKLESVITNGYYLDQAREYFKNSLRNG